MGEEISDEELAAMRGRTGAWPKNSAECNALIARLDSAESKLTAAEAVIEAAREAWTPCDLADRSPKTQAAIDNGTLSPTRRWCLNHQEWDYDTGPRCAMADLRGALAAYDQALSTTPKDAQ